MFRNWCWGEFRSEFRNEFRDEVRNGFTVIQEGDHPRWWSSKGGERGVSLQLGLPSRIPRGPRVLLTHYPTITSQTTTASYVFRPVLFWIINLGRDGPCQLLAARRPMVAEGGSSAVAELVDGMGDAVGGRGGIHDLQE